MPSTSCLCSCVCSMLVVSWSFSIEPSAFTGKQAFVGRAVVARTFSLCCPSIIEQFIANIPDYIQINISLTRGGCIRLFGCVVHLLLTARKDLRNCNQLMRNQSERGLVTECVLALSVSVCVLLFSIPRALYQSIAHRWHYSVSKYISPPTRINSRCSCESTSACF